MSITRSADSHDLFFRSCHKRIASIVVNDSISIGNSFMIGYTRNISHRNTELVSTNYPAPRRRPAIRFAVLNVRLPTLPPYLLRSPSSASKRPFNTAMGYEERCELLHAVGSGGEAANACFAVSVC